MRRSPIRLAILLATCCASSVPLASPAQGVLLPRCIPDATCRALPNWSASISRTASHVRVTLADRVLHYEVDETFVNRGGRVGEADYIFPLPHDAAFADLKLSINGELVSGETMDASRARSIYEEIVRRQRDPALVEWMGYGMLRARIFPILSGEEKRVVVRFDQVAQREGDAMRVDYVRGSMPNGAPIVRPASTRADDVAARSAFTLILPNGVYGRPYSPTNDIDVSDGGVVNVSGDSPEITLLIPLRRSSSASISVLANRSGRDDGFALITLAPRPIARATTPRDVTFVLDVSGSMNGRKMEQARAAGHQLLTTLSPRDRFRLIDFSTDVRTFRGDFVDASPANLRAASQYLDALDASGGTNIGGALEEALREGANASRSGRLPVVLFVTDGEPTVGERDATKIGAIAARLREHARLFTFGLGADVNASLLEQLALDGHGTAQFVRPNEDVERMVSLVASRIADPIATDVRVESDGVRLDRMEPAGPIDIFAGQDAVILARYNGSGSTTLRFTGNTPSGRVTWTQRVDLPESSRRNDFVPRLWATRRIGYLSAERRRNGPSSELDGEIRALGEQYGIPTELTSFLVQEPGPTLTAAAPSIERASGSLRLSEVTVAGATASAPSARGQAFESAKQATAQRSATNVAMDAQSASGQTRRIGDRVFILADGSWADARIDRASTARVIRVQPYSAAYFKVLDLVPDLSPVFALGDKVRVAERGLVLELAPDGATSLSARDLAAIHDAW